MPRLGFGTERVEALLQNSSPSRFVGRETKELRMDTSAYHEYLQSDKWKSLRLLCLTRDQYRCRVCNESEHLEVHHRTYERIGQEQLDDLTTLCDKCHELYTAQTIKPSESKSIGEGVMELLQEYDARKAAGDSFRGIPTGFLDLDNFTAGFQNSEF